MFADLKYKANHEWRTHVLPLFSGRNMLPDFLVLGAQKCGSSSIFQYLGQHPQIILPRRKEAHYFDVFYRRGLRWYKSLFFPRTLREERQRQSGLKQLTFEDTPDYIFHPHSAARAAKLLPEARLIVLLRDPVMRAYSHYWHEVKQGHEKLSFAEAIAREPERMRGEYERIEAEPLKYRHNFMHCSYMERGKYAMQLDRWMKYYRRDQLLILKAETLFTEPAATFQRVLQFLELPPCPDVHFEPHHVGKYKDKIPEDMYQKLMAQLADDNAQLRARYGAEFDWDVKK